jgi:hypothetical protein
VALPLAFDHSPLDQRKALETKAAENRMRPPHLFSFPNPFIAIAIAGAVTIFSVGLAAGHPLAGAAIAGIVGAGGMVVGNGMRNSENRHTAGETE